MKLKLGAVLVREGLCTVEQIEQALHFQVFAGGRLGSNLIELGSLSHEDLARVLAKHHGVPVIGAEELESALPSMPRVLKVEQIAQFQAFPLRIQGRTLHVAVVDPGNVGLTDTLRFATGLNLQLYVVAEALFWAYADAYFGITRPDRAIKLDAYKEVEWRRKRQEVAAQKLLSVEIPDDLKGRSDLFAPGEGLQAGDFLGAADPASQTPGPGGAARAGPAAPPLPAPSWEELAPVAAAAPQLEPVEPGPGPGREAAPPAAAQQEQQRDQEQEQEPEEEPLEAGAEVEVRPIEEVLAELRAARDREEVADAIRSYARGRVERAILFYVRGTLACGFACEGTGLRPEQVLELGVPLEKPSAFREAYDSKLPYLGAPPPGEITGRFHAFLGPPAPRDVAVVPVKLGTRVVNLLYLDNGSAALPPAVKNDLVRLAQEASLAYSFLVQEARARLEL